MHVDRFFAPCPRGLEPVLAHELNTLGASQVTPTEGGVAFAGDFSIMMKANLHSRTASRILWRLGQGRCRNEADLYKLAAGVDWPLLFAVENTIKVKVDAIRSPLTNLAFAALKIKDAVCDVFRDKLGERPSVNTRTPDMRIQAFLTADTATLYLDTSGEALFKRGWRRETQDAPLRENLAAGILLLAGYTGDTPLFDPMCGSGTLLIEAADIALNRAPGRGRSFAFPKLNGFVPNNWATLLEAARAAERRVTSLPIHGSDRYVPALETAHNNLVSAGLEKAITLASADILETRPWIDHGLIVTNPPYGVRLDDQDRLAALYPRLGDWLKQHWAGWNVFFLTGDPLLAKKIRLSASRRTPLFNGAIECRLFEYRMIAGGNRRD
jgi:putative N6-adenine-specific DNA methylase